jgi:hypothetical protein
VNSIARMSRSEREMFVQLRAERDRLRRENALLREQPLRETSVQLTVGEVRALLECAQAGGELLDGFGLAPESVPARRLGLLKLVSALERSEIPEPAARPFEGEFGRPWDEAAWQREEDCR